MVASVRVAAKLRRSFWRLTTSRAAGKNTERLWGITGLACIGGLRNRDTLRGSVCCAIIAIWRLECMGGVRMKPRQLCGQQVAASVTKAWRGVRRIGYTGTSPCLPPRKRSRLRRVMRVGVEATAGNTRLYRVQNITHRSDLASRRVFQRTGGAVT